VVKGILFKGVSKDVVINLGKLFDLMKVGVSSFIVDDIFS